MEMNYDIHLFIQIIESIQGVVFLRQVEVDGEFVMFYQGLTGKMVQIDMQEEFITPATGKGLLKQLGLEHLIPSLFPATPMVAAK